MSGNVSLQDLVYFGTAWQLLNGTAAQTTPIVLGGGYQNATVLHSDDGNFFAGVVEKTNGAGAVTDVVLAFAGAVGAPDILQAEAINLNLPSTQAEQAAAIYDRLLADPRYADAVIHVTGHSLGAALTQYVLGHSLALYGDAATQARADFVQFAPPAYAAGIAAHFGLASTAFDGHITGYVAQNDQVLTVYDQGATQMGTINYLAPNHAVPLGVGIDNVSAHFPSTYIDALGLPSWLSVSDQAAVAANVAAQSPTPLASDYGPVGGVSMTVAGDSAANHLTGSSANDVLIGRGGQDTLHGGLGADLFVFAATADSTPAAPDLIDDFSKLQGDQIDLRGISHSMGASWFEHVQFIGTAAFTAPGQVRSWNDGHDTWVAGDFGADLGTTLLVKIAGVQTLGASDLLLNDGLFQPHYAVGYALY